MEKALHDVKSQGEERCLTLVAVSHRVEVDVVVVTAEEHQTEPRVKRVDRNDEENAHDPALLVRARVAAQVRVYLQQSTPMVTRRQDNLYI